MERFVRCRHCNLPHLASVLRCPFSGQAVDPQTRLPEGAKWKPSRDDLTGTLLDDRYMLGKRIGDGAMGSVYRSEHVHLGTTVAVKVLHSRFESGSAAERRFLREGQSAGRIDHPNVVRIFDVGRLPDGAPYIVMEHLDGHELSSVLANQRLAMALDFSIAKDEGAAALTGAGDVLGTPHYLAPEQAMGKSVDARVDLWAAAVVTYEMLTGRPPFEGDNFPALVMGILTATPTPPSECVLGLPPEVDAFFARALAKEPDERFQDAASMRTALAHAFQGAEASSANQAFEAFTTSVDRLDLEDTLQD